MKARNWWMMPPTLAVLWTLSCPGATGETQLSGTVRDAVTGKPIACVVRITDGAGQVRTHGAGYQEGFRCDGRFEEMLPPGRTQVRISRGFEYQSAQRTLTLGAGEEVVLDLSLERVVDLRERGWYSGDSHAHMIHGERTVPVSFDDVALAAQAEDLQYLSLSHAWAMASATPETLEEALGARSTPDCHLTWNLEAPKNYYLGDAGRCLGHCWGLAVEGRTSDGSNVIPQLRAASAGDYASSKRSYANFESHRLIHEQGGAVFYTHPLRWWTGSWGGRGGYPRQERMRISNMAVELPLDVVAGPTFDGLDVITGAREYQANAKAFELWAMLLNHGYRLAATGSSDACFDRPGGAVPGVPRTYTYMSEGFSLRGVARATAAGRTFVTTGPLLLVSLGDQPPGTSFRADGAERTLSIEAWASGQDDVGLKRVEVLRRGRPVHTFELDPPVSSWRTNVSVSESQDAWYGVRVWGGDERSQQAISGAFFFETDTYQPPEPTRARISARVVDARTDEPLEATLTVVSFVGPNPRLGGTHQASGGKAVLEIPATSRLKAQAPGYSSQTLSPFFNHDELLQMVTRLEAQDLLNWATYERIRQLLRDVRLTFRLKPIPGCGSEHASRTKS